MSTTERENYNETTSPNSMFPIIGKTDVSMILINGRVGKQLVMPMIGTTERGLLSQQVYDRSCKVCMNLHQSHHPTTTINFIYLCFLMSETT